MEGVGGLSGWRWIFILEGIATVILSIVSAVFLPANLESAKFLTEEERTFASKWAASLTSAKASNYIFEADARFSTTVPHGRIHDTG